MSLFRRRGRLTDLTPLDVAEATLQAAMDVLADLGYLSWPKDTDLGMLGDAIAARMCAELGLNPWDEA